MSKFVFSQKIPTKRCENEIRLAVISARGLDKVIGQTMHCCVVWEQSGVRWRRGDKHILLVTFQYLLAHSLNDLTNIQDTWRWRVRLSCDADVWIWRVTLTCAADVWRWRLTLTYCANVRSWCLKLMYDTDMWCWCVTLACDADLWRWRVT